MNICTLKLAYPYGNNAPDDWFCIQTSFSRLPNMPAPCSLPYAYKFEYLIYKFLHIISHLIDYIRKTSSAFFTQSFSLFISITPMIRLYLFLNILLLFLFDLLMLVFGIPLLFFSILIFVRMKDPCQIFICLFGGYIIIFRHIEHVILIKGSI